MVRQQSIDNRTVVLPDGGYLQVFGNGASGRTGIATSSDGIHWTDEGDSPIGYFIPVRLADGTYRAFGPTMYRSTDAKQWTVVGRVTPAPEPASAQCFTTSGLFSDVVALPDGRFRAYFNCVVGSYYNILATAVRSATSKDGLVWQSEPGDRINPLDGPEIPRGADGQVNGAGAAEHPQVIKLPDGTLKMFYWSKTGRVWSATSVDGLIWTNRRPENLQGSDPDAVTLPDGRVRLYVNGDVGLPGEVATEGGSRTASYVYGPTTFRLSLPGKLPVVGSEVGRPAHLSVAIEGSGHSVRLGAFVLDSTNGTASSGVYDIVNGPYDPVKVVFKPPSGKPPFTADATFNWTVGSLDQSRIISGGTMIVADDGSTKQVVPVDYASVAAAPTCGAGTTTPCPNQACGPGTGITCGNPGCGPGTGKLCGNDCGPGTSTPCLPTNNCGPGTGTPCPPTNCGPGTGTPCPPTNCGPGTGTPCIQPSQGPCTPGTACPGTPDNCGPGQQFACPSPAIACQKGQPIPSKGCVTGGYDGKPKLCLPMGVDPNPPVICQEFY